MGDDIWSVYVSPAMRAKLGSKHGLTVDDVLDACHRVRAASWVEDDLRGRRLFLEGWNERGRLIQVVLYPTAQRGAWNLGTAQFAQGSC